MSVFVQNWLLCGIPRFLTMVFVVGVVSTQVKKAVVSDYTVICLITVRMRFIFLRFGVAGECGL